MLDALTDTAEAFAADQSDGLSWETKRNLFIWLAVTAAVMVALTAIIEGEALSEFVDYVGASLIVIPFALQGAGASWDKVFPNPDQADDEDDP